MKLTYRGIHCEYDPTTVDMIEGEVGGKYRGQEWTHKYPRHIPVPQASPRLKYRGTVYCTNPRAAVEAAYAAPSAEETQIRTIACTRPAISDELAEIHQENIRRNLEYRLQVARERGDEKLVKMLEAESNQLVAKSR